MCNAMTAYKKEFELVREVKEGFLEVVTQTKIEG